MKLVQNLLSPQKLKIVKEDLLLNDSSWGVSYYQRQIQWYSWIWSFMSGYKNNQNIELITDDVGKIILLDILKLPYKNVKIELNNLDQEFWFLGKIKAYSLQTEPFLHYDGDVIFNKFYPVNFVNYKLFGQNLSPYFASSYLQVYSLLFSNNFNHIPSEFYFNPSEMNKDVYLTLNSGVFGGNDLDLINECSTKTLNFMTDKTNKLLLKDFFTKNHKLSVLDNFNFMNVGLNSKTALFSFFEEFLPVLMYKNKYGSCDGIGTILQTTKTNVKEIALEHKSQSKELDYIHLMEIKSQFTEFNMTFEGAYAQKIKQIHNKFVEKVRSLYPEYTSIVDKYVKQDNL